MKVKCAVCELEIDSNTWHYYDNTNGEHKHICSNGCLDEYSHLSDAVCAYCGGSINNYLNSSVSDEEGNIYCCHVCFAMAHNIEYGDGVFDDYKRDDSEEEENES